MLYGYNSSTMTLVWLGEVRLTTISERLCCVTPTVCLIVRFLLLFDSMETLQDVFQSAASVDVNQVEYSVYLPRKQDPKAMMEYVQESLAMVRSIVQPFTDNYLWQKDQFHLAIVQETGM